MKRDGASMVPAQVDPSHTSPTTIVDALVQLAGRVPDRLVFSVTDMEGLTSAVRADALLRHSLQVATGLQERGMKQGDRVLICLPTSVEILHALFGILLAGGVAVPVYPPLAARGLTRWQKRVEAITRVAQPRGAVISSQGKLLMAAVLEQHGEDLFTVSPSQLQGHPPCAPATIFPEDLAFIQFTSGTTSQPRGVSVSHASLMANIRALVSELELGESDISVSWLPPYHDMGLVGHIFTPVYCLTTQHLLSATRFLQQPRQWLRLITETGATQTTAPNFAYSMCVRRIPPSDRGAFQLGSLKMALNGAELVQRETLRQFSEAFEPSGFSEAIFRPVYGLAEATLAATISPAGGVQVDHVDRERLARDQIAQPAAAGEPSAQPFVSVGRAIPGHALRLVRKSGRACQEREVGEIMFQGPSVTDGYFNDPLGTARVFRDGWLATGDLGYMARDMLYITGRKKELIIKNGRNLLPQDLEAPCLMITGLRSGRAVALGLPSVESGTEDLVLVAEVKRPADLDSPHLREQVARVVHRHAGTRPDRVELVKPGTLPRTTSGKLQRNKVRAALQAGVPIAEPPGVYREILSAGVRSVVNLALSRARKMLGWQ